MKENHIRKVRKSEERKVKNIRKISILPFKNSRKDLIENSGKKE